MSLTEEQTKVYDKVIEKRRGAVLITGHAGTGKTFLATEIMKTFDPNKIIGIAPTHQAKLQFSNSLPESVRCVTLASFIKSKPEPDEVSGELKFIEGKFEPSEYRDYILVFDECSMIGEEDLEKIYPLADSNLLIFLGDFNQLDPVNKSSGLEYYSKMEEYVLKEQHRNAGAILSLCDILRTKISYPKESSDGITVHNNRAELLKALLEDIGSRPDPYDVSYLAYTNQQVNEVRDLIHEFLYGDNPINKHQYIRLETPCEIGTKSEVLEILKFNHTTRLLFGNEYPVYVIEAENIHSGKSGTITVMEPEVQEVLEIDFKNHYDKMRSYYGKIQEINNLKRSRLPYSRADESKLKKERNDILSEIQEVRKIITMISSPFALTVHKSQGKTIPVVYLDTKNISEKGRDNTQKLLYVGCSRTKENLHTIKV